MTTGISIFVALLGVGALVGGLVIFLRARFLERACSQTAPGTVTALVDEASHASSKKPLEEEQVVAANEAIAAKKRAYQAKRRDAARRELDRTVASWRATVTYSVDGATYEARATRAVTPGAYKISQATQVHYDPACPGKRRWLELDGLPISMSVTVMICGGLLILIAIACWFVLPWLASV